MRHRWMLPAVWIFVSLTARGQDAESSRDEAARHEPAMVLMEQRVAAMEASDGSQVLEFGEVPILRYNDVPRQIVDASVWRIGERGRPRALLVLEIYSGRSIQYEFTGVADPPSEVRVSQWRWRPQQSQYAWVDVPVDEVPMEKRRRQRQIKQLARDFSASETFRGETYQLRLLPQPLCDYSDPERGVLEGAVFAWTHGTNVEIVMLLESRDRSGAAPSWVAGFSRLGSASLDVDFREQDFWDSPTANRPSPDDSYYYRMDSLSADERSLLSPDG